MKREIVPQSKGALIVYRIIVVLILVLLTVLIAGSIYGIARPEDSGPLFRIGGTVGGNEDSQGLSYEAASVYSGIGRLRIPVAGQPPITVILSVGFPYPADDRPFTEELASQIGNFRSIATEYFASLSREQIINLDEELAKAQMLERYNALLRLGRIETLYFGDLMIME